ncbi:MAG: hypothetical protein Q4C01_03015 [Clostridia bacterium]|nr:hypothetical protein [Clostridia bacterium]
MTTQDAPKGLSPRMRALDQAIEKVFASRGLKYKVSYEKAGQHMVTIHVKLPKQTENTKKE